jgi:sugar phosphate isomerase/epimerase
MIQHKIENLDFDKKLCLSTTVFGKEKTGSDDLLHFLDITRASGFELIEISRKHHCISRREASIRATGVQVWSIHGILGMAAASLSAEERQEEIDVEIRRMEDAACFAPCPYVVHYVDRFLNKAHGAAFRKSIEQLHKRASSLGYILAVETAPYKPLENERYPDSLEIADFVRSFGAPDLKMTIDINHSNLNENLEHVCRNCKDLIANVHISDNHGQYEQHLPPGEGIIDLPATMRDLRANGYRGPCNLELHLPEIPDKNCLSQIHDKVIDISSSH